MIFNRKKNAKKHEDVDPRVFRMYLDVTNYSLNVPAPKISSRIDSSSSLP